MKIRVHGNKLMGNTRLNKGVKNICEDFYVFEDSKELKNIYPLLFLYIFVFNKVPEIDMNTSFKSLFYAFLLGLVISCAPRGVDYSAYIPEAEMPDVVQCIPAPPAYDSEEFAYDELRYQWGKQQRMDSARLAQARRDAVWSLDSTIVILSEAAGMKISEKGTPCIYKVLRKGVSTIEDIRFRPKAYYFRMRPFAYYKEPSIFPEDDEWLATEGSYPSGHTIRNWACALIMSEINPEAAEAIFERAWIAGENRVVSGCHWQSDVDASRPVASIGYAKLQTSREYCRDMARAQREFRRIKR